MPSMTSRAKSKTARHSNRTSTGKRNPRHNTLNGSGKIRVTVQSAPNNGRGMIKTAGPNTHSNSSGMSRSAGKSVRGSKIRTTGNNRPGNNSDTTSKTNRNVLMGNVATHAAQRNSSVFSTVHGSGTVHNTGSPSIAPGNNAAAITAIASLTTASKYILD